MKTTKKLLAMTLAVMILISSFALTAQAISTYNNHTSWTDTAFYINEMNEAEVHSFYRAYESMTEATITITLKKRTLLFFWDHVMTFTLHSTEQTYSNVFYYQLTKNGTYKCEVEYCISGTGGEADIITFEDTASF